ncbi:ABC transporter ATP-binding protein [Candidatus Spongiihabitans sp.]|uniref:ABC transporter ATP-binding protein n=1 Tax=Candidatus Spongiihabitans sp. TaxID=3101308 RepID=UPI003C7B39E6
MPQPQSNIPPNTLLSVKKLNKEFNVSGGLLDQLSFRHGRLIRKKESVQAINGISLDIVKGEALCLVGESGCGKTTVGRIIMGLLSPSKGTVHYLDKRIDNLGRAQLLPYRKRMQMIFQNPYASLNPRKTVATTLLEPVRFHFPTMPAAQQRQKVEQVMESVGVNANWGPRFPHEFSGGQRQRISIARALMVDPEFIVADEPISALDVSIQAQVLNLLMQAREDRGLTYLFITHDLSVVEHFGSRIAVMYLGRICELGVTAEVFSSPRHPYTQALLSAIPKLGQSNLGRKSKHIKLKGEVPTPINLPSGCVFHGRCPHANQRCSNEIPELNNTSNGVQIACHAVEENRI